MEISGCSAAAAWIRRGDRRILTIFGCTSLSWSARVRSRSITGNLETGTGVQLLVAVDEPDLPGSRHTSYTQNRRKRRNGGALSMHRFVLFALLLFPSTSVLCQSTATPPGNSQAPGKPSAVQWPLDFSSSQPGQTAARPAFKGFDCHGPHTTPNQANAPIDLDHLFNAPCAQVEPLARVELFARNENSFSRSPFVVWPHLKGEPIPTQWPSVKTEQIPTEWPNLKLQPINGRSPGLVPAHGSQK
jgi:hypothetical protein